MISGVTIYAQALTEAFPPGFVPEMPIKTFRGFWKNIMKFFQSL
jgi:hypothetical protein